MAIGAQNQAAQLYGTHDPRIDKFKGKTLKHAVPVEVLGRVGRQEQMPKNNSRNYVARRWLPWNATTTRMNTFFSETDTGDRAQAIVDAHRVTLPAQEGRWHTPESITPHDVVTVIQQYDCLYSYSDITYHFYEDDIPAEMSMQVGERVGLVNEMIIFSELKSCTNQYFASSQAAAGAIGAVDRALSLELLRKVMTDLMARHGKMITRVLAPSANFNTEAVSPGYMVYVHTNMEPLIRDLRHFTPTERYAQQGMKAMPQEIGCVERFRFIGSPELVCELGGGADAAGTGLESTNVGGTNKVNVYRLIVMAADAFSQLSVRGLGAITPTFLPVGMKTKSDPHGKMGLIGACWYKACKVENNDWMAVVNCGIPVL